MVRLNLSTTEAMQLLNVIEAVHALNQKLGNHSANVGLSGIAMDIAEKVNVDTKLSR